MKQVNELLAAAREASGLTQAEAARAIGVNVASYHDLESYPDELAACLALGQLASLCNILDIKPRVLFQQELEEVSQVGCDSYDFHSLAERLMQHLASTSLTLRGLEDRLGWKLGAFIAHPASAWAWNVDCLRDVCRELGTSYLSVLSNIIC